MNTAPPCLSHGLFRALPAIILLQISGLVNAQVQNPTLEVLDSATLQQQIDHLRQRTNIYNGYRAVRDDIFLKMMRNSLDSLNAAKREINQLESTLSTVRADMASLDQTLQQTTEDRDQAIHAKNSLSLLGIQMNKALYNSIMWIIILGLLVLATIFLMMLKRNFILTRQTSRDLEETREEFEAYRQQSRERYEKLVVQHHKEILKLKGKKPGF